MAHSFNMAASGYVSRDELMKKLEELGISAPTVDHEEVLTVEALLACAGDVPGIHAKNLFMKDKKKGLWLLSARHNAEVNLKDLAKAVSAPGGLRLADEKILEEVLGVKRGCVTAFALINDKEKKVKFMIDEELLNSNCERVYFHPLDNTASTGVSPADLAKFLEFTGHEPIKVKLNLID